MRPFLIIGLGGSGGKTIRYLKQSLSEWLTEIGWDRGFPHAWQFLHIDTPQVQDSPVLPGSPDLLPPSEYLSLYQDGVPFATVMDRLRGNNHSFEGWWVDPAYMHVPIAYGAGQFRAVGRILGLDQRTRIQEAVNAKITALRSTEAIGELQDLASKAHESNGVYTKPGDPVAMVISSLAGGTGAGIFMDVTDMLRAMGEQWLDMSFGILYAADVFQSLASGAKAGIHPNAAAALAELVNGIYASGSVEVSGEEREIGRSGPAFPFLVGHANTSGVVFGDQTEVYRVMGRCLAAVMTDPKVQDDFVVYTAANWAAAAATYPDAGGPRHLLMEPPYKGLLQGLGYAEVDLGVDRFRAYSERRITRDAVETLVRGHLIRTGGQERYEGMTPEAISASIADDRLTGFLNTVGINERGPDNNQVLDAIALPVEQRQRITGDLARQVFDLVTESMGTKARVDDWVDEIVTQAEILAPGENERYDATLRERAREWSRNIVGRLTEEVGEIVAEWGLPVARDLLHRTRDEIRWVVDELEQERREFETLASHVRSNVQAAFGELSGQVGSEHDAIGQACASAIETLVWHRMEEKVRFIAREMLADFSRSVIDPLIEAIRLALGDLERRLDPADVEATPVDGWPRHAPERDQAVPDDLIPGKTVSLVLEPETFPRRFEWLVTSTLGRDFDTTAARWREIRRQVVTGAFLERAEISDRRLARLVKPLFEIVDEWQPNEAILLGGEPDRPARFKLHVGRDDVVLRARAWLTREGSPFDDFLSLGLRGYLREPGPTISPEEAAERERAFQRALASAFEAAKPLVNIDPVLLSRVHGKQLREHVVAGEIPLKNHRLESWVIEFLDQHVESERKGEYSNVTQDERVKRISIYSMLDGALHPAVFESITEPIAAGYNDALQTGKMRDFWKWRRSRPLANAIPLPMPMIRALIRGWFIGRFLGLIDVRVVDGKTVVRLSSGSRTVESPPLVDNPGNNKPRQLGAFLESLALGIPYAAEIGRAEEMLRIYGDILEMGRVPGSIGAAVGEFNGLSAVLEEWISSGTVHGRVPTVPAEIQADSDTARAERLAGLARTVMEQYAEHARPEIEEGRLGPENAWLGVASLIQEELHRLANALSDRARSVVPSF